MGPDISYDLYRNPLLELLQPNRFIKIISLL